MSQDRGGRVLVVEDDVDTREVLAYALAHEGFEVRTAPDGERALELARAWRPDVVLADVLIPGLGGNELAEALLRDPELRDVPLVSMSASPAHAGPPSALLHVEKAFAMRDVVDALRSALRAGGARRDAR